MSVFQLRHNSNKRGDRHTNLPLAAAETGVRLTARNSGRGGRNSRMTAARRRRAPFKNHSNRIGACAPITDNRATQKQDQSGAKRVRTNHRHARRATHGTTRNDGQGAKGVARRKRRRKSRRRRALRVCTTYVRPRTTQTTGPSSMPPGVKIMLLFHIPAENP